MPRNRARLTDRIMPVPEAGQFLSQRFAQRGWERSTILKKIKNHDPFVWVPNLHYFRHSRGISSINVDAVVREILKCFD